MPKSKFFQSFHDAFSGVRYAFYNEKNFRFQIFCALLVLALAVFLPLNESERLLITVMTFMVLVMELLNTAIEKFIDLLKPRLHHYAKTVKDIMAGAVLMTALAAVTVGIIIFVPHIVVWLLKIAC